MSKFRNIEHNLLARLGNAATNESENLFTETGSVNYVGWIFQECKKNNQPNIQINVLKGDSNVISGEWLNKICQDLRQQLEVQMVKLNMNFSNISTCEITLKFDFENEEPVSVNSQVDDHCIGSCKITTKS